MILLKERIGKMLEYLAGTGISEAGCDSELQDDPHR